MIQRLQTFAWDSGYLLRELLDAARWPVEKAAWTVERVVVWPLRARAGGLSVSARAAGLAGLVALAAVAAALGIGLSSGGGTASKPIQASAPPTIPVIHPKAVSKQPPAPVLQGVKPNFSSGLGGAKSVAKSGTHAKKGDLTASSSTSSAAQATTSDVIASAPSDKSSPPPAAAETVHEFSSAFLLYEIGKSNDRVDSTLSASSSPRLVKKLLNRPPRLPANVDVPKAKVLNVVPGPRHGRAYTFSVSLLRLGITSELRLEVEREGGEWQVTNVLG